MNDSLQSRVVEVLALAGYVLGAIGVWLAFSAPTIDEALRSLALFSVGALGIVSFLRHSVFHRADAARMGWLQTTTNNFQIEVGMANLAWAVVAFVAVLRASGRNALAAVCLVFAVYLAQAGLLHLFTSIAGAERRSRSSAVVLVVATLSFAGALAYFSAPVLVANATKG